IHERLQHYEESKPVPVLDSAAALAHELSEELRKSANGEMSKSFKLLAKTPRQEPSDGPLLPERAGPPNYLRCLKTSI
ncbi:MAGUK p55 subfamily member 7, partial [Lates japonicus]